jgi:hypothetical protein
MAACIGAAGPERAEVCQYSSAEQDFDGIIESGVKYPAAELRGI